MKENEWSASPPSYFMWREGAPASHWIGGWVVSSAALDALKKNLNLNLSRFNVKITQGKLEYKYFQNTK